VIRSQRSPYGTSLLGAGAVHHIKLCRLEIFAARCFTPETGHWLARLARPKSGQKRTLCPQSISSSALASSEGGTLRPSALAVLRLITSSNFVG
jgi:hypothetical protein